MGSAPEPVWGTPQNTWVDDSALASLPLKGSLITGMLLRLLESHFNDANNIKDDKLKAYLWADSDPSSTPLNTKIFIGLSEEYDAKNIEKRPALLVKRNEIGSQKVSLAGKAITHLETNGTYRGEHYLRMVSGTHLIICVADGSTAVDRMAEEVFYRLLEYGPSIKEDLKFSEFEPLGYGPAEEFKVSGEKNYMVRISVKWATIHSWELLPISPILKKVRNVSSDL